MEITIGGSAHKLTYNFKSLKRLGIRGATDSEGLGKVMSDAGASWEGLAALIAAGLGREPKEPHADIAEFVDALEYPTMEKLLNDIAAALGLKIEAAKGDEQSGPPADTKTGTNAAPSPASTSA